MVERPTCQRLDPRGKDIEREAIEFGNQIAVAAEQLVVAIAAILERPHVAERGARLRRWRPLRADRTADLVKAGVGQTVIHQHVGGHAEESRDRCVRVDAVAGPDEADFPAATIEPASPSDGPLYDTNVWPPPYRCAVPTLAPAEPPHRGPPGTPSVGGRVRNCTLPPRASLPYCALDGPRTISIVSSAPRLDQVEERVDAAALRTVRVPHAVDEHVDLVAGQAAHEDTRHRRARLLEADAGLAFDRLRDNGRHAGGDVFGIDDVDWLAGAPDVFDEIGGGGNGDFFAEGIDLQRDLEGWRTVIADGQRHP